MFPLNIMFVYRLWLRIHQKYNDSSQKSHSDTMWYSRIEWICDHGMVLLVACFIGAGRKVSHTVSMAQAEQIAMALQEYPISIVLSRTNAAWDGGVFVLNAIMPHRASNRVRGRAPMGLNLQDQVLSAASEAKSPSKLTVTGNHLSTHHPRLCCFNHNSSN